MYSKATLESLENNQTNMGFSGTGNLFFLGVFNPLVDSVANKGINKTYSLALEKALMSNSNSISYLNSHILGGQFLYNLANKTPLIKSFFPEKTTKSGELLSKIFKNTEFHHIKDLPEQIADGTINADYKVRADIISEALDKNINQNTSDFVGAGFSFSDKKINDKIRYLHNIGLTPDDLTKSSDIKNGQFVGGRFNQSNLFKDIQRKTNKVIKKDLSNLGIYQSVSKDDLTQIFSKYNIASEAGEQILKDTIKDNSSLFANETMQAFKVSVNVTDDSLKMINSLDATSRENLILGMSKYFKRFGKKNAREIASSLTEKTVMEKVFSNKALRFLTGSAGGLATVANLAGAALGIASSLGQENAIDNLANTVLGRGIENNIDYTYNEAGNHSIETHLNRRNADLEEYKKIYYYRNTANELRDEMVPVNINFKSVNEFETI